MQVERANAVRYIGGAITGFAVLGIAVFMVIASTRFAQIAPPPAVTNRVCFDEKLRVLKKIKITPTVMEVGSSVTWRNLDTKQMQEFFGDREVVYNGAPCGLTVDESFWLSDYYASHFPSIRKIITFLGRSDFATCRRGENRFFNSAEVTRYLRGRFPETAYYFMHFDPISFFRNTSIIANGELAMNHYGDLPIPAHTRTNDPYRNLPVDDDCFAALHDYALFLQERGIHFIAVLLPTQPKWEHTYDRDGASLVKLRHGIRAALAGTSTTFLDASSLPVTNDDFVDAVHFKPDAAKVLTHRIVEALPNSVAAN